MVTCGLAQHNTSTQPVMADTPRTSIPLYHSGACIALILVSQAESNPHMYRVFRNKRGNATLATIRDASPATEQALREGRRSRYGRSFEQSIPSGHVWALRGVRGSDR